jgi:hypothetical protein
MTKLKQIERAEAFIHKQLSSGPQLARNIIADSNLNERTMERAARRMKICRERLGPSGPWIWRLPR